MRGEQQDRQELQAGRDAERPGAAGEREDQPVLGDALHPRADVGHQRAGGEQAVVADAERGERAVVADAVDQPRELASDARQLGRARGRRRRRQQRRALARSSSRARRADRGRSHAVARGRRSIVRRSHAAPASVDGGSARRTWRPSTRAAARVHEPAPSTGSVDRARHRRRLDVLGRGQLADGGVAESLQRRQHGQLGERQVAVAALEAQRRARRMTPTRRSRTCSADRRAVSLVEVERPLTGL